MIRRAVARCGALCRAVITNDIAWLFVTCHCVVLVLCIANMSPPDREFAEDLDRIYAEGGWCSATVYAGRPFHLHYESLPLQLLVLVDLPSEMLAAVIGSAINALVTLPSDHYHVSYIVFGLDALFGSLQWLTLGAIFGHGLRRPGSRGHRWVTAFRNHRTVVFTTLLIVLLIGAPLLQWRSYQLGFRHAGISFGPR